MIFNSRESQSLTLNEQVSTIATSTYFHLLLQYLYHSLLYYGNFTIGPPPSPLNHHNIFPKTNDNTIFTSITTTTITITIRWIPYAVTTDHNHSLYHCEYHDWLVENGSIEPRMILGFRKLKHQQYIYVEKPSSILGWRNAQILYFHVPFKILKDASESSHLE